MVSDNLRDAVSLCETWYQAEPSLATFILRAIFEDLHGFGWTNQQGVPNATYQPFQNSVLPHIVLIVDSLAANPNAQPMNELDALVVAYRDFLQGKP
jgi:hypothetical protein